MTDTKDEITWRDELAKIALQGTLAAGASAALQPYQIASFSYKIADEMIKIKLGIDLPPKKSVLEVN